ncbi:unnamed protein product [Parajaminaea phylloscopi]
MAPSLHISAGPEAGKLSPVAVNHDEIPCEIESAGFRGRVTVRIKSFTGHDPEGVEHKSDSEYFDESYRKGITWSVQMQGRFLKEVSTDDVVFGNEFDKPIRSHLPYGTSLALQFVKVVDPNMQHDLYSDKPWAYSPFIATMTHINVQRLRDSQADALTKANNVAEEYRVEGYPAFPSPVAGSDKTEGVSATSVASQKGYVVDDTAALISSSKEVSEGKAAKYTLSDEHKDLIDSTTFAGLGWPADEPGANDHEALQARKRFFGDAKKRSHVNFTPCDVFTADFCNGFIDFNTLSLSIPFSGGLNFDLKKYWDGQPVRYSCKNKKTGEVYFVVQFTIQDLDA